MRADLRIDRQKDRQTDRQRDRQTERQTDRETDRQTDMTNLIAAFRNFVNELTKSKQKTADSTRRLLNYCQFLDKVLAIFQEIFSFFAAFKSIFLCWWPRDRSRRSASALLLGLRALIPPGSWKSVSWECCVLLGRDLCNVPITRPEESYSERERERERERE